MVVDAIFLGGLVGVALSGGFVYWEVGRYATPQVPVTLFDERKEVAAYTVGLFVGVPLAVAFLLFLLAMASGALVGALASLALLVGGTEVAQWAILRTKYWGAGRSGPFYALGFRAAIGGILALALVASLPGGSGPALTTRILSTAVACLAVVALEVSGALVSLRLPGSPRRSQGGPLRGGLLGAVGLFLLGLSPLGGATTEVAGPVIVLLIAGYTYYRLRGLLSEIPPPAAASLPLRPGPAAYGRTPSPPADGTPGEKEP
jgi:hypothetical protein